MRTRHLLLWVVSLASAPSHAFLGPDRSFRFVDSETGQPIARVFVAAEYGYSRPALLHGTASTCISGGAKEGSGEGVELDFENVNSPGTPFDSHYTRTAFYAPGYCIAPNAKSVGGVRVYSATKSTDPPEHRIIQLGKLAGWFSVVRCHPRSTPEIERNRQAVEAAALDEARGLAKTDYERYLVRRLQAQFESENVDFVHFSPGRGFAIVDDRFAPHKISWEMENTRSGGGASILGQIAGYKPPEGPPRWRLACPEAGCDFERRGRDGQTYLYERMSVADDTFSVMLIDAGADPDATPYAGGPTGLDHLMVRLQNGGADAAHFQSALAIMRSLAKSGRATVHPERLDDWRRRRPKGDNVPDLNAIVAEMDSLLASLSSRKVFVATCPLPIDHPFPLRLSPQYEKFPARRG